MSAQSSVVQFPTRPTSFNVENDKWEYVYQEAKGYWADLMDMMHTADSLCNFYSKHYENPNSETRLWGVGRLRELGFGEWANNKIDELRKATGLNAEQVSLAFHAPLYEVFSKQHKAAKEQVKTQTPI